MPQNFARRARLSSKAILAAVSLTLAALVALLTATNESDQNANARPDRHGLPTVENVVQGHATKTSFSTAR